MSCHLSKNVKIQKFPAKEKNRLKRQNSSGPETKTKRTKCSQGSAQGLAFAKGALPEEYLSNNFDEECLGGH